MVKNSTSTVKSIQSPHPYINLCLDNDVVLWFDVKESIKAPVRRAKHKMMKQLIEAIIDKGVGDRISRLTFGKRNNEDKLVFAFNLNATTASINYIRGPSIDSRKEASDFRVFWDNKTDCRRYPDLSTCETMYLPVDSIADRRHVTTRLVKMLLEIHLGIPSKCIHSFDGQLDEVLRTNVAYVGTGEEEASKVNASLMELNKLLRGVKSDAFEIHSLQGISPVCRGAEVRPPVAGQYSPFTSTNQQVVHGIATFKSHSTSHPSIFNVQPIETLLQLEVNNIYSDDIEILRGKKIQIILQLCQLMQSQVGLKCKASATFIDAFFDGLVFRLIVCIKREVSLLRQVKTSISMLKESLSSNREAEQLHVRNEILPKLTASLNGISTIYGAFSPACRSVKRFLSAHCLLDFFSTEAVELIVAYLFTSPEPFSCAPNSPSCAFVRSLHLLATFAFSSRPLVVNLNGELIKEDVQKIEKVYASLTSKPGLFVVTPYDTHYGMFSRVDGFINSPLMVNRMQMIATEWCNSFFTKISTLSNVINVRDLFVSTITDAHVLIYIKDKFTLSQDVKVVSEDDHILPIVAFDPVSEYIAVLRRNYDAYAFFLYDKYSVDCIYLFWKSEALQPVTDDRCKMDLITGNSASQVLDLMCIIENIEKIGTGIVQRVVVKSENWPV